MRFVRIATILAVLAAIVAPTALALAFEDSDFPLPDATVGVQYDFQLKGRAGCPSYVWTVISGALPPGIQLTTGGNITGIPTAAGSWGFYVDLADTGCPSIISHSQRAFTLNVIPKVTVTTPSLLASGVVGVPYSLQLTADGGGSQVWSVLEGTLPAGLTLSPGGLLAGTPTTVGATSFRVFVKDTSTSRSDTKNLALEILAPLTATAGTAPDAEVGIAFKGLTPTATGGKSPYTWSIVGRPLPAGLTLDPTTGAITGTPTGTGGKFALKLGVSDANKTIVTVDVPLTVARPLGLVTMRLPSIKVGGAYQAIIRTRGGVSPIKWKVTSGRFPGGIRLDTKTGVIAGMSGKAGVFTIVVTVTDRLGATAQQTYLLAIKAKPKTKAK